MEAKIFIQKDLDVNLTYSNRVGKFTSKSLWMKILASIRLLVLQFPL